MKTTEQKNGILVINDELIFSRVDNVESNTVLNRKSGKEGPVSDFIMCSFTNNLFGSRLRVKGETQEQHVEELIGNFPPITTQHNKIMLTFDRGCGKMTFDESMSEKKLISPQ